MSHPRPDYSDQVNFFDPEAFTWDIEIVGLGGIGSALLLPLVKLGFHGTIRLWDPDSVEPRNVPAQMIYGAKDNGKPKVHAAADFVRPFAEDDCTIEPRQELVTASTPLSGVVFNCVDSMAARRGIWQAVCKRPYLVPAYFDGRLGGEFYTLQAFNPSDEVLCAWYDEHRMFDDSMGAPLECGVRTNPHTPLALVGAIVGQFTRFSRGGEMIPLQRGHTGTAQLSRTTIEEIRSATDGN